jgi:small subunit ribosomal protein S16
MLKIILSRTGKKKQAYFKILVTQKEKDPWGTYLENLGNYNPRSKQLELKADRIKYWLSQGAQPSATIWNMLVDKGLVEGKKQKVSLISKKRSAKIAEKTKAAKEKEAAKAPAEEKPAKAPVEEKPVEIPAEEPKVEVKAEEPKKE